HEMPARFPCSESIQNCDCRFEDFPVINTSAELPDDPVFLANDPPVYPPPLGKFGAAGCLGQCESTVSQLLADQCAARQAFVCALPRGDSYFPNQEQSCAALCADGTPYTYTVPYGTL